MRKLATIRRIDDVKPIPNADKICAYQIGGWWVVDSVGKYKINDLAIFCEVDSFIPTTLAPFLTKSGHFPKVFEGVEGERLRTIKLRGQLSQGLLMPLEEAIVRAGCWTPVQEGDDVTEWLGIKKWEKAIPAQLAGQVRGNFPSLIPKTDQERCQNLKKEINAAIEAKQRFEVTEKLEGSSMTCYVINGEFGVCSRNLDLKRDENNSFWKVAIEQGIEEKLLSVGVDIAIQGELIGPGVQDNIYKLSKLDYYVFDVYKVMAGGYMDPADRREFVESLGLKHVPVLSEEVLLIPVEDLLTLAESKSVLNDKQEREGIVFREVNGGMSFKAISNAYLMKSGD